MPTIAASIMRASLSSESEPMSSRDLDLCTGVSLQELKHEWLEHHTSDSFGSVDAQRPSGRALERGHRR
jgi:hypothetical protein